MKKILTLTLLAFSSLLILSAQKKVSLPTEIKGENFLLKYKYDNQNRIIERFFQNDDSVIRDSIIYIPSQWKCIVYSFDESNKKTEHIYIYGKKRESGQWIEEINDSDGTLNYFYDSLGYVSLTKGREWDGSWKGGPNLVAYKYDKGNLSYFYLDTKYQQREFIQAMADLEQLIFDEDISYDNKSGIFSWVSPESRWLLVSPVEEFYPILHLKNNAVKIGKPSEKREPLRDFDNYQPVDVTYKYDFNKSGYPQKMKMKILDNYDTVEKQYTITYQNVNPKIHIAEKEEPLPSGRKMLPVKLSSGDSYISYTYDTQNRFTSIKEVNQGSITRYDSIAYYPNREGYKKFCIKDEEGDCYGDSYYSNEDARYTRKGNMIIMGDEDGDRVEVTFTPTGMVSMMKSIAAGFDPETSIDPPVIIGYVYDKNDNLIDMALPNNASGDRVNRNLQMIEYMRMNYDNKNGIFKHVNRDCFMILYNQGESLNYYYYMGNNLLSMEDEYREDSSYMNVHYIYNKDDYPIMMNQLRIEYIDAH